MFGIGFTELLLISIVAILFLGPDKLPQAMVEIAKFIKSVKKTVGEAKNSLEEEMRIADLKEEALHYKQQLDSATSELRNFKNIDFDEIYESEIEEKSPTPKVSKEEPQKETLAIQVEPKQETVTFKKKTKDKKSKNKETTAKGDA